MIQVFSPYYRTEECLTALRNVLDTGWTGTGPKCTEFETKWNQFIGSKHSHFVNSATAALHLALRLLDLPQGTKVVSTPVTFVSTNAVILYEQLVPVFCDIDPLNFSLSFDSVYREIKQGCKAVMWVHYAGSVSPDFYKLMNVIKEENLDVKVIEDCAHAAGALYADGSRVGSRQDTISCFSYQSVKNLNTFDGGMICVQDEQQLERVKKLAWLGIDKTTYARSSEHAGKELYRWKYSIDELGWKYNGNDVAATLALVQLKYLDADNAYRRQLHDWYVNGTMHTNVQMLTHEKGSSHHVSAILCHNRDAVLGELRLNGIAPGVHYSPNFEFPAFSKFYTPGSCPNAERYTTQNISLPQHLKLSKQDIDFIVAVISKL